MEASCCSPTFPSVPLLPRLWLLSVRLTTIWTALSSTYLILSSGGLTITGSIRTCHPWPWTICVYCVSKSRSKILLYNDKRLSDIDCSRTHLFSRPAHLAFHSEPAITLSHSRLPLPRVLGTPWPRHYKWFCESHPVRVQEEAGWRCWGCQGLVIDLVMSHVVVSHVVIVSHVVVVSHRSHVVIVSRILELCLALL